MSFACGSSNVDLSPADHLAVRIRFNEGHPISEERLREFAFEEDGQWTVPSWYTHNLDDLIGFDRWTRNFAIMFNNFGMEKL